MLADCTVLLNHPFSGHLKDTDLASAIGSVRICETSPLSERSFVRVKDSRLAVHLYQNQGEPEPQERCLGESEHPPAFTATPLPSALLDGLWESLHYEGSVQFDLLRYVDASMQFVLHAVDPKLISFNRLVLLHGPPGTGKTSLCRALAQKVAIRLPSHAVYLLEVNSQRLLSKWFSESAKLIAALFDQIAELAQDECNFLFLLIDEAESLTMDRAASVRGSEPSDAVRAVNALLTHLDRLRDRSNVLVLATSNLLQCLDAAFVDRVDWSIAVPLPGHRVIYTMLLKAVNELLRVQLISPYVLLADYDAVELASKTNDVHSQQLLAISIRAKGLSGRSLKKIPFLAFARASSGLLGQPDVSAFLAALAHEVGHGGGEG